MATHNSCPLLHTRRRRRKNPGGGRATQSTASCETEEHATRHIMGSCHASQTDCLQLLCREEGKLACAGDLCHRTNPPRVAAPLSVNQKHETERGRGRERERRGGERRTHTHTRKHTHTQINTRTDTYTHTHTEAINESAKRKMAEVIFSSLGHTHTHTCTHAWRQTHSNVQIFVMVCGKGFCLRTAGQRHGAAS